MRRSLFLLGLACALASPPAQALDLPLFVWVTSVQRTRLLLQDLHGRRFFIDRTKIPDALDRALMEGTRHSVYIRLPLDAVISVRSVGKPR